MAIYSSNINNGYKLELVTNQVSQSIEGNYSNVSWELFLIATNYYFQDHGVTASIIINGNKVHSFSGKFSLNQNSRAKVAGGSTRVDHNADGTKSFGVYAEFMVNWVTSYTMSSKLIVSGNMTLDTIPRASKPTTLNGDVIGYQMALVIDRKSAEFTHTVAISFNDGQSWSIYEQGITNGFVFTPDISNCGYFPNSVVGQMLVRVLTYKGSSYIGEARKTYTVRIPDSVKPSFSITYKENNSKVSNLVGSGNYVQGQSTVKIDLINITSQYGAAPKSYKIEFDGASINLAYMSKVPMESGTLTIKGTVTDSRGRSTTETKTIYIMPYKVPSITKATYERSNSDGGVNPLGTYLKCAIQTSVSSLKVGGVEKNTLKIVLKAKKKDDYNYQEKLSSSESGISFNGQKILSGYDANFSYSLIVEVTDLFSTSSTVGLLPTGEVTMHWHRRSVAIGKILESLDFNLDAAEKGTNSDGGYFLGKKPIAFEWDIGSSDYYESIKNKWGAIPDGTSFIARVKRAGSFNTIVGLKASNSDGAVLSLHVGDSNFFVYMLNGGTWSARSLQTYITDRLAESAYSISLGPNMSSLESGGYMPIKGFIDNFKRVRLQGVIKPSANTGYGATVLTLPTELRPSKHMIFTLATSAGSFPFILRPTGVMVHGHNNAGAVVSANGWISLDGITFIKN